MPSSPLLTITALKKATLQGRTPATIHVQIESLTRKETKDGKPFYEVNVADGEGKLLLRAWSDAPSFCHCEGFATGHFLEVSGDFISGNYGLESKDWRCRELTEAERDILLSGSPEARVRQAADYEYICTTIVSVGDPRLRVLGQSFLAEFGERFRRTAAARMNHHARRGGLVEHTAQMMRSAMALAGVYTHLNRDLLAVGVLFHDAGKLWENAYPADAFNMPFSDRAELLGHIPIGIELVNTLWRKLLQTEEAKSWTSLQPESEQVRLHLLHLVASHHGELQFGSPVVPKTPEGWALHHVDNLDAKLEMMANGYAAAKVLSEHVYERVWPLPGNLVGALPAYEVTALPPPLPMVVEDLPVPLVPAAAPAPTLTKNSSAAAPRPVPATLPALLETDQLL